MRVLTCSKLNIMLELFLVMAMCIPLAGPSKALTCDAEAVMIATTPAPPGKPSQVRAHEGMAEKVTGSTDYLAIGDSLVHSWPAMDLQQIFASGNFVNLGLSGDTTEGVLWRLLDKRLASLSPKVVLLLVGTNNLSLGHDSCAIAHGISKIVGKMDQLWKEPKIVIIGIPPRGADGLGYADERLKANKLVEQMSNQSTNMQFLNIDAALADTMATDKGIYTADMIHFKPHGYKIITGFVSSRYR